MFVLQFEELRDASGRVTLHFRVPTELPARLVVHWRPLSNRPSPHSIHPPAKIADLQLVRTHGKLPRHDNAQGHPSRTR